MRLVPQLRFLALAALCLCCAGPWLVRADPTITEFMASNKTTLYDQDGYSADWIEIYNPDSTPDNLLGYYLTDKSGNLTKWQFPAITLQPNSYLIVFASGKNLTDPTQPLATNFDLSASGEYLGLIKPDGKTVVTQFSPSFPQQYPDVSYGVTQPTVAGEVPQIGYFEVATPGGPNGGESNLLLSDWATIAPAPALFSGSISFSLGGAQADEKIRYVVAPPSSSGAAVAPPTASSPQYAGTVSLTGPSLVRAAVFSSDDSQRGFPATALFLPMTSAAASFSSGLSLLVLDDHGYGPLVEDGIDHPAWIFPFSLASGASTLTQTPDFTSPMTMTVRGFSSANFPKKSWDLDLVDTLDQANAQPLLGLGSFEKWALVGPWYYDRAYIRNAFMYALSNSIDRWAASTHFAEAFFKNDDNALDTADDAGIYVLTDKIEINPGRININSMKASDQTSPADTGGYILSIDHPNSGNYSWVTQHGVPARNADPPSSQNTLQVDTPNEDVLVPAQQNFITGYVQEMENAMYADQAANWATHTYLNYLDRPSWVDSHILNVLSENPDWLSYSTYFYKDESGLMISGPIWDFDRTMGSADGRDANPQVWMGSGGTDPWTTDWYGVLVTDPDFMQAWIDRWFSLRQGPFAAANLMGLVDGLAAQIDPNAAARDAAIWPDDASRYGNWMGEVNHMKDWLVSRVGWIDSQFLAPPLPVASGGGLAWNVPSGAQLVYTTDGSDPRSSGGAVGATATVATGPLTLPAAANVIARSYQLSLSGPPPSSPWSAPVASSGRLSSSTGARLSSLSIRGYAGAGSQTLVGGVIVNGGDSKNFLLRALGPSLASAGISDPLPAAALSLFAADGTMIASQNGWDLGPHPAETAQIVQLAGEAPLWSAESALVPSLYPGAYTFQLASPTGIPGVGMFVLDELDQDGQMVDLSARGWVGAGGDVLIGGFIVSGAGQETLLIRAVSSTLAAAGVNGALSNPVLTLYSASSVLASNNNWDFRPRYAAEMAAAAAAAGAEPLALGSKDAAIVATLGAGAYTVVVTGKEGAQGVAELEIYEVPSN